jgi:hypothetical protein
VTNLSSPNRRSAGIARQLAVALALASGTALLTAPGFTDAAHAQRKKKDEKEEAGKPVYSKEFVAAYQPLDAALKAPGADYAVLKQQVLALVPMAVSPDEQQALGGMIFNTGINSKDPAMQLQGAEIMIASGVSILSPIRSRPASTNTTRRAPIFSGRSISTTRPRA